MRTRCNSHPSLIKHNDWERLYNRWQGEDVVCIASGPSLTTEDVEYVRGKARIITVNNSFRAAPFADIHYSSDHDWWEVYHTAVREEGEGEMWTGHHYMGPEIGAYTIPYNRLAEGLTTSPRWIVWGGNSGYCATQIAYLTGARRIILLGYDMSWHSGKKHWHGDHQHGLRNDNAFDWWKKNFAEAAKDFKRRGVEVINASRVTALECFPRARIEDVL